MLFTAEDAGATEEPSRLQNVLLQLRACADPNDDDEGKIHPLAGTKLKQTNSNAFPNISIATIVLRGCE